MRELQEPKYTDKETAWLKQLVGVSFEIGFYAALLCVLIVMLMFSFAVGKIGPVKKALSEKYEKAAEHRQMQSDEQSESGERERG